MASLPSIEDLRLVLAISTGGSVGTAARELRIAQPSASQRLARLERACGTRLFDRDTRGARPTAAGIELARQAAHILGHLDNVYDAARAASADPRLVVGTFASLGAVLFPILDDELAPLAVEQRVDHGRQLVQFVAEGTMDAAFIAIVDQLTLPRAVQAQPVGHEDLMTFLPAGVDAPRGRKEPLKGLDVPFATYDAGVDDIRARLIALGAKARRGVTLATTVAMARRRSQPAVVPPSALAGQLQPGERLVPAPLRYRITLSLVTPSTPDPRILRVLPTLRRELGLRRP
ncbi:LysR family transcriptional regulator [Kribbella deserti]|uniref:LysR family transcriptional regulator n=1 Tax=Kribbella deserti TaxID=1926257 RepID=A0ABV6QG84_9ACTN